MGIRWKLAFVILLILVAAIGPLSWIILTRWEKALLAATDASAMQVATSMEVALEANVGRTKDLSRAARQFTEGNETSTLVYAAFVSVRKRRIVAHSDITRANRRVPADEVAASRLEELVSRRIMTAEVSLFTNRSEKSSPVQVLAYEAPLRLQGRVAALGRFGYDRELVLRPIRQARISIYVVAAAVLVFAMMLVTYLASRMTVPIRELTEGAHRIGRGDLDRPLRVRSRDEIGQLAESFNQMMMELKEKLAMSKFISSSTQKMIRSGTRSGNISLGGERKNVVLFFSDVRAFTAMSEKLRPEQVVSILNEYLDLQARVIAEQGGDIDKFAGDEVMAVFEGRKGADAAAETAVTIQRRIAELNREKAKKKKQTVSVGIGLHCGAVVAGNMGSRDRMDYTVIGDTVNTAARLCGAAPPGQIYASAELVQRLSGRGKFPFKKTDPVRVKGKSKALAVYAIDES